MKPAISRQWLLALPLAVLAGSALIAEPFGERRDEQRFSHARHATLFPLCTTCHAGVVEKGEALFPSPASCTSCHDGVVEQRVSWAPPGGPRGSNLRFTHDSHHLAVVSRAPSDSALARNCSGCHTREGEPRMAVRHASARRCLACHGFTAPHVDNPPAACAKCHVPVT